MVMPVKFVLQVIGPWLCALGFWYRTVHCAGVCCACVRGGWGWMRSMCTYMWVYVKT